MSRIFITGSSTGLGLLAGRELARARHEVVLHARNEERARDTRRALPQAEAVAIGDIGSIAGAIALAEKVNALGRFDAVIHNAALGYGGGVNRTEDGLPAIFAVNSLAPWILTRLIEPPRRLVYLSSSMHAGAALELDDPAWARRRWNGATAYSESKLHVLLLAFGLARLWPDRFINAVDPGWVPTRMGGAGALDDLHDGCVTQAMLAAPGPDQAFKRTSGRYFRHMVQRVPDVRAEDAELQDRFLKLCARVSGLPLFDAA